jgi:hypothetical protein
MTRRLITALAGAFASLLVAATSIPAQGGAGPATLRRAETAYRALSYGEAITLARRALGERLSRVEQERAYEVLGFAYAALDSARQSTEAFKQLLFLDPDRVLDPARISPKITSLFSLALGQVLVVRNLGVDSITFVAGREALPIHFTVTRTARIRTRVSGPGVDVVVDSSLGEGRVQLRWNGMSRDGRPVPSGSYRVVVETWAGRDAYAASFPVRIVAGGVDTVAHLTSLPGYSLLPETEVPPRSWRPLGLAFLATALTAGGSMALENAGVGGGGRRELAAVGVGAIVAGALATAKRPAPVPASANIRYNTLVREQLARRNGEIAAENAARRRLVQLSVVPERPRTHVGG